MKKLSNHIHPLATEFDAYEPDSRWAGQQIKKAPGQDAELILPPGGGSEADNPFPAWLESYLQTLWRVAAPNKPVGPQVRMIGQHRASAAAGPMIGQHRAAAAAGPMIGQHRATPFLPAPRVLPPSTGPNAAYEREYLSVDLSDQFNFSRGVAADWIPMKDFRRVTAYTFRGEDSNPTKYRDLGCIPTSAQRVADPSESEYRIRKIWPNFSRFLTARIGKTKQFTSQEAKRQFEKELAGLLNAEKLEEAYQKKPADSRIISIMEWYVMWRGIFKPQEDHLGNMLASEIVRNYVSTSRSLAVAVEFSKGKPRPWVYAMHVRNGFVVPKEGTHKWVVFSEQEIAHRGEIKWPDVVGMRQGVSLQFQLQGPVYLRKDFLASDPEAAKKVFEVFSGKPQ